MVQGEVKEIIQLQQNTNNELIGKLNTALFARLSILDGKYA